MMNLYSKTCHRLAVFLIVLMPLITDLPAQTGSGGTRPILHEVGASARAFGLGRAYTALADDPSALFWNPAGMEYVPRVAFSLFRTPLIVSGANYDFMGFVYPTLQYGSLGLGFASIGVDDIIVSDNTGRIEDSRFAFDQSELYIAYAKTLPYNITGGATFKLQRQAFSFGNQVNSAFGFDFGLMYRPEFESPLLQGVSVGFQFQNAYKQQLKLGANDDPIAYQMSFGLMKSIPIGPEGKVNVLVDVIQGEFDGTAIHAGTEYVFRDMGTLRVGFDENTPAFGAGITYKFATIDYAFGNLSYESDFPASHRFSVTFNFGLSRAEKVMMAERARLEREHDLVENTKEEERQKRIAEHMQRGKAFLDSAQYFDAYSEFQQVIADAPFDKTAKALFDSTRTLITNQFAEQQAEAIAQAVDKNLAEENRKFVELHFQRGQVFLQNKQFTDALIEFNLALERAPDDALILEAINTSTRRLNAEARSLITSAREQFRTGNYSEALTILSDALVLTPEADELKSEIQTLTNRIKLQQITINGLAYLELGEYDKAKAAFEEGLRLDPANESIKRYLEIARGKLDTRYEKMDPESETQYLVGTEHFLAGRYEQALDIWRALQAKYPYNKKLQDAIKTAEDRMEQGDSQ